MKTFKLFANLYCVLLYVLGLIYAIDEFIAYHLHHDFFEGYRVAVPLLIFIFFHFPVLLFFLIMKDVRKWIALGITILLLILFLFLSFAITTKVAPIVLLINLIIHAADTFKELKVRKLTIKND